MRNVTVEHGLCIFTLQNVKLRVSEKTTGFKVGITCTVSGYGRKSYTARALLSKKSITKYCDYE